MTATAGDTGSARAPSPLGGAAAALVGLVAGLLTVGIGTLLGGLLDRLGLSGGQSAPVAAVGGAFIDLTPAWLKDLAIAAFGTNDKRALLVGTVIVLALVCAGIGLLARRRMVPALVLFALVGAVGLLAVLTRPGASSLDALPTVAGTAAGLWFLSRTPGPAPAPATPTRRLLLGTAIGGAAAYVGSTLGGASSNAVESRRAAGAARLTVRPVAVPSDASVGVDGVVPYVVPNDEFYRIDTALVVPRVDAAEWRLRVTGMVEREVEIDWATLQSKPMKEALVTLACVSNDVGGDLVGNAVWTGWPVRELLAMARPLAGADMVLQTSVDGWTCGTPLPVLTDDRDALLAVRMNGEPLPFEHGFPVRLVVPGLYGYVSATKWVTELKVTTFAQDQGYWTPRGWSAEGPIKTASRIDVPRVGATVRAGRVAVAGVAWAQHRGIRAVEVQVDEGPWQQARLAAEPSVDAWRQWVLEWDATPGSHTLRVRATDGTGQVQAEATAPPAPDGATGWHTVTVRVDG